MKSKSTSLLSLLSFSLLLTSGTVFSAGKESDIVLTLDEVQANVGNRAVVLPTPPVLEGSTTLVPLRFISETLGLSVQWDDPTRKITMQGSNQTLEVTVGSMEAFVNGKPVALEQAASIRNDVTMVPLRFVSEYFGQLVSYDAASRKITLSPKEDTGKESKPAAAVDRKKRLEKVTVDNLMQISASVPIYEPYHSYGPFRTPSDYRITTLLGMVITKGGDIYYLENKRESSSQDIGTFAVKIYRPQKDLLSATSIITIDKRFNLTYKNSRQSEKELIFNKLQPVKLLYDEASDKVFLLSESFDPDFKRMIFYELRPEVKPAFYSADMDVILHSDRNVLLGSNGQGFIFSDVYHRHLHTTNQAGQPSTARFESGLQATMKLTSLVLGDQTFLLDQTSSTLFELTPEGVKERVKLKMPDLLAVTAANGFFYAADKDKVVQISIKGEITPYVTFKELTYTQGQYNPETMAYEEFRYSRPLQPFEMTQESLLVVDANGNVYVFDRPQHTFRRFNVFSPA